MLKQQKGITLIALVITIIVLLILAGVTIAMLTGSDSAPAKANEAKQKQDIGAAKDQIYIAVSAAQADAYEQIYVKGLDAAGATKVKAGTAGAGTQVSAFVKSAINKSFDDVGSASIKIEDSGATIKITTTDWKDTGHISSYGAQLTWDGVSAR